MRQAIVPSLPQGAVIARRRRRCRTRACPLENATPHETFLEEAVEIGPAHAPVRRHRSFRRAVSANAEGREITLDARGARVDLVGLEVRSIGEEAGLNALRDLDRLERRAERQQREPRLRTATLHAVRILHHPPQHLIAAADAEERAAPPDMRDKRFADAARLDPAQIGDGALPARQADEAGPGESAGASGADHAPTLPAPE